MNTIHSSSLAFYPVGYNQPRAVRPDNNLEQKQKPNSDETGIPRQNPDLHKTSSTAQIKAALADNGLTVSNNDQPSNSRTLKALNAYTENRNQPAQNRVAEIISGIDLYV
ncbi:hypothetical protein RO575_03145 [Methylomonas sp. MO1]|uniref:hypothetical protein n=1 Tax=Methylomonas sp. MO1 TaxID=3073619 RepID=UPI0028A53A7F|nr:hypothetical protein [Methylomonas sp. MO1]MDT4288542.1 hypothetical protein [Methylomonas sp. MO1]